MIWRDTVDKIYIGIDIGSVSINIAVLEEGLDKSSSDKKSNPCSTKTQFVANNKKILEERYVRIEGNPIKKVYKELKDIFEKLQIANHKSQEGFDKSSPHNRNQEIAPTSKNTQQPEIYIATTGSGGKLLAKILGIPFVNEVIAQAQASWHMYPEVRSIVELGGEDSKFISIKNKNGIHTIADFAMNTLCAAGTGSFLDQQSARLGLDIKKFSELGLTSKHPPRIAGRCSVFANTDMIHLQQEGTSVQDIVAGLCFALARNFKSVIAKGKKFTPPVLFQGGVAYNLGMRKAFKEILGLKDSEFIIPEHFASMGAIGAILSQTAHHKIQITDLDKIQKFLDKDTENRNTLKPLSYVNRESKIFNRDNSTVNEVWMGIDIGSISTNVILLDKDKKLVARRYLWTQGRPIDAVLRGIHEIGEEVGKKIEVKKVGVTGSGRYMIGDLVGADIVRNEITSQARASAEIDPNVDTIFEIGGQDSKYISLHNGVICDFEMNKVCAAGTGSFLEEQAERLNLNIKEEFGKCALSSKSPIGLGDRCTVFMQSSLTNWQQKGALREDLAAGLAYSIAQNYLNKVATGKKIGGKIFFQGAVAFNKAIVAAFQEILGQEINVPPNNDVTGAIGVAILSMEAEYQESKSKFKGFDLSGRKYNIERFECKSCPNHCEIKKVILEGEEPLYYGSRCEKYEKKSQVISQKSKVDLFNVREKLLLESYNLQPATHNLQPVVGIPKALIFHEYLPFWTTFFKELNCKIILSESTNKNIIHNGVEATVSDHCFPIKACHGHVLNLIEKGVDYIFLPSLISMKKEYFNVQESYACPFVQAIPYLIKSAIDLKGVKLIAPILHLKRDKKLIEKTLIKIGNDLGKKKTAIIKAIDLSFKSQDKFYTSIKKEGEKIIDKESLETRSHKPAIILIGRPYNTCDRGLNLNIPKILSDLGILVIPMDFLPLESIDIDKKHSNMYWKYGQRILVAAELIKKYPNLYPLYITNFGCGADSFVMRHFKDTVGDKPHLIIEVDEHSAPAGVITRCEAFLDSIKGSEIKLQSSESKLKSTASTVLKSEVSGEDKIRTLFIPFMGNNSRVVAAAFRHCGIPSQVLPVTDSKALEFGRKHTTGKECYPYTLTTGDMIKFLKSPDTKREETAFFIPRASGPCRLGQYSALQRIALNELGYEDVPIISPNQAKRFHKTLKAYGQNFEKRGWYGICAVDILDKLVHSIRPYEINKGETDKIYEECLDLICKEVEGKNDVTKIMPTIKKKFLAIPIKREARPLIGITGEIYVRSHHFSNDNIVRRIEDLGGEIELSGTSEWFFYTNFRRKEDSIIDKNYKELISYWLQGLWQQRVANKTEKEFHGYINHLKEPTTKQIFAHSNPYLHQTVEGEAVLTVGKCIDFMQNGIDGIITVMPFTCMPGTNTASIMAQVQEKYNVPYLNIAYDGVEQSTTQTRLEAFMHQTYQYQKAKNKK